MVSETPITPLNDVPKPPEPSERDLTREQTIRQGGSVVIGGVYVPTITGTFGIPYTEWYPGTYLTYRQMLADPTIALARAVSQIPILTTKWGYEGDPERVEFIRAQLEKHEAFIKEEALRAVDFGWQSFEIILKVDEGALGLDRLKPLIPDISAPLVDKHGALVAIRNQGVDLPAEKSLVFTYDREGDNHYGRSRLENVRDIWNQWRENNDNARRLGKKVSGTVIRAHFPPGTSLDKDGNTKSNFDLAKEALQALAAGQSIAVPNLFGSVDDMIDKANLAGKSQWVFDTMDIGNTGPMQVGLIEERKYNDQLKLRGYLVPERAAVEATQSGSRADSETHGDAALGIAMKVFGWITREVQAQLVDRLLRWNYGEGAEGTVKVVVAGVSAAQIAFFRQLVTQMFNNPSLTDILLGSWDLDAIMDVLGIPQKMSIEEAVETIIPPEPPSEGDIPTPEQKRELDGTDKENNEE